jgi:hypothetical protein
MVETCMISFRESNHEFASPLVASVHPDSSIGNALGIHQGNKLKQKIRLGFKKIRSFAFDRSLKLCRVFTRDAIPGLRLTPVHCESPSVAALHIIKDWH